MWKRCSILFFWSIWEQHFCTTTTSIVFDELIEALKRTVWVSPFIVEKVPLATRVFFMWWADQNRFKKQKITRRRLLIGRETHPSTFGLCLAVFLMFFANNDYWRWQAMVLLQILLSRKAFTHSALEDFFRPSRWWMCQRNFKGVSAGATLRLRAVWLSRCIWEINLGV